MRPPAATSVKRPLRRIVGRGLSVAVLLVVAALACRAWVIQGLILPVRIAGGSMAQTLCGDHWRITCADCGFAFCVGVELPPDEDRAVCPNCGYAKNSTVGAVLVRGDRVLIDKATLAVGSPRRWEVVAFRPPVGPETLAVKRVVGLPGERVSIRHGDLYIDGQLASKPSDRLRELSQLVHDGRFVARGEESFPPGWLADRPESRWRGQADGFDFTGLQIAGEKDSSSSTTAFDWLTYRHGIAFASPAGRQQQRPVMDNDPYNQGLARGLNEVSDLWLSLDWEFTAAGRLALLVHDGRDVLTADLNPLRRRVEIRQNEQALFEELLPALVESNKYQIEFGSCDGQVWLAIDGREVLRREYPASSRPFQPTSRPLAIGADGGELRIRALRIYRDIYYLDPVARGADWSAERPLGPDEYFLLGDNSPVSLDSRQWPRGGGVPRRAILGRVIPFQ